MMSSTSRLLRPLVFACAAAALFASGLTAAKSSKPFQATITISEQLVPVGTTECQFIGAITGTGQATHMGKLATASQDCVNQISATTFSFASQQVVLTAANGDQVFASYGGTLNFESGVGVITGGYTITGGTGRFAGATGGGSLQGLEEVNPATGAGRGQIQLNGTISY